MTLRDDHAVLRRRLEAIQRLASAPQGTQRVKPRILDNAVAGLVALSHAEKQLDEAIVPTTWKVEGQGVQCFDGRARVIEDPVVPSGELRIENTGFSHNEIQERP